MRFQSYPTEGRENHFWQAPLLPEDETFHAIPADAQYNWAETNMFGFTIPEHQIDCMIWFVYWPKLGTTYGGLTIFKGIKAHYLESEIFDFRVALPLPEDNTDWECPNGLTIRMIEPLKSFHISYREPGGDTTFDMVTTGIMPPAVRYNGNHITQAMKCVGHLDMGGTRYPIDGYYSRDRSWREHRNEAVHDMPPLSWIAGVFGDDFAFHLTTFESSGNRPEWAGHYPHMARGENVLWGYVWHDGKLLGVKAADVFVDRPDGVGPAGARITIETADGDSFEIEGRTVALNPAMGWPNISVNYAFTEWRCRDRVGHGDIQDCMFRGHRKLLQRPHAASG